MEAVILRKGRERSLARRHPWVFSGAVERGAETAAPGETVEVRSASGERLALGWWSPASQIRVRIVPDAPVASLVADAIARRRELLASGETDAVRLVNAEADFLPGVVADFYAGYAVCQFTSVGADLRKREIAEALAASAPGCKGVAERLDADARRREGLPVVADGDGRFAVLCGEPPPERIEIREHGRRYLVDVRRGHKTGFYLDQRDARTAVAARAAGRRVLNCFSFTGGFGIAAAVSGAAEVVNVDVSADALALADENAALNVCADKVRNVEADVFKFLRKCRDEGRTFDMIVLDPPKFAESRSQVMKAARGYKDINLLAMKLLAPGGVLATFSCSGAITRELFDKILCEAAEDAGRDFAVDALTRQSPDHAQLLSFPEGSYLKGTLLLAR